MKVYLCYECRYVGDNEDLKKIVDSEEKAIAWFNEVEPTDDLWREYEEKEVES